MQTRDISIDILRAIAMLGLIAAHVFTTNDFVLQLRSFDVPMMVFLSGVVYSASIKNNNQSYFAYIFKRFVRIIIPTWIFITFYFGVIKHDNIHNFLSYYSLLTNWYVWIMRVFFIIAIISPVITKHLDSLSNKKCYIVIYFFLVLNEILCGFPIAYGGMRVIAIMNIAYVLVFCLGYIINRTTTRSIHTFIIILSTLYVIICLFYLYKTGEYILTNTQKYPPQLYYLSYALAWIYGLWLLKKSIVSFTNKLHLNGTLVFIGSHTMWIYFWHIVILDFVDILESATFRYVLTITFAVTITLIQHEIIIKVTHYCSPTIARYSKMIFDG